MTRKRTRKQIKEGMRRFVNQQRDIADEMARHRGCDDPMHPWGPQVFRDYVDFIDRVCRPLIYAEDQTREEEIIQTAMALYRKQSPYGIAISMVMLMNRVTRAEAALERLKATETICDGQPHKNCWRAEDTCASHCKPSEGDVCGGPRCT